MERELQSFLTMSLDGLMKEAKIEHEKDGVVTRDKCELIAGTALLLSLMALAMSTGGMIMSQMSAH